MLDINGIIEYLRIFYYKVYRMSYLNNQRHVFEI